jgi:hypothetical protein
MACVETSNGGLVSDAILVFTHECAGLGVFTPGGRSSLVGLLYKVVSYAIM